MIATSKRHGDAGTANVFVLGLDEFQREKLDGITGAASLAFHGLLDRRDLTSHSAASLGSLLDTARAELDRFEGTVDAIVAHWDFPTSVLAPILASERGLPTPSVQAVLCCEHKYWSRSTQRDVVGDVVPRYCWFDPFSPDPRTAIDLDYPFWVKPVKSHSSQLGFKIEDDAQFDDALVRIRDEIHVVGDVFDEALQFVEPPPDVAAAGAHACLAEEFVIGRQLAPEGSMHRGDFRVHGVIDMPKDERGLQWSRLVYPARIPEEIQQRMATVSERYLRHIGYDNGCFNVEFLWDEERDRLWLIEVNTRISQSHADLFEKVDGTSNHEVAVAVALGRAPSMPHRRGRYRAAAKCQVYVDKTDGGVVTRVPSDAEIQQLAVLFPGTIVHLAVEPGDRLSDLTEQSSYRYDLATIYLGARDHDELDERYQECRRRLRFDINRTPLP